MAKELPYFKFHVSEWINGDITLESLEEQGAFINICAYYWFKDGVLKLPEAKRRLTEIKPTAFQSLIKKGFLKLEKDFLKISFLDQQLSERDKIKTINSLNGKMGGRPKQSEKKPTALISLTEPISESKAKQKPIREEEEQEKNKSERREYGPTHKHFIIVQSKYLNQQTVKINGKDGLIEYMEANQTILNQPEHGDKFMRDANGKVFNELSHVQNAYGLFVKNQFK